MDAATFTMEATEFYFSVLTAAGGGGAVAYAVFKFMGGAWLEAKFDEQLENIKAKHAEALAHLKVEIDSALSGAIKLQEREFDVLPKAWEKLDEAYCLSGELLSTLPFEPELDALDDEKLSEFLQKSELTDSQRKEVTQAQNKRRTYTEIIFWYRLLRTRVAIKDLRNFKARNGIFLPDEIKVNFTSAVDLLWSAVSAKEIGVNPVF